jgi:alpha-L-fucosidase
MNKNIFRLAFTISLIVAINYYSYAQNEFSWEQIEKKYEYPAWYTEAGFGIWVHWGAQTQPEKGGGWYARHMYMQDVGREEWGANAYPYHVKTYGHPSGKGFKDVIHEWKAENLDTDALLKYFKILGAKYFVALANHHDHFDNFESTHHPWNSVNVGPKRDIIEEFSKSAQKYDIPFGVSSHDDRFLNWWLPAFGSDETGPLKGVSYDGHMTKEDGQGKWWEGLDPADLYGLPPEKRTPDYKDMIGENYMLRHKELVTKYDVDYFWFDGHGFPYGEYGKEVCRTFFNHNFRKNGKFTAVIAGKFNDQPSIVKDIERGVAKEILYRPWQGIITFNSWFYKNERELRHNARTVIEILTDARSKNGNLLLNVELLPDGTIPPDHKDILDDIGEWVTLHGEAIYASKPWKIYGDNLGSSLRLLEKKAAQNQASEADLALLEALNEEGNSTHFTERTVSDPPYGPDEVRFTVKDEHLYIFVMNPSSGTIRIPSLGTGSREKPKKIRSIYMLGSNKVVKFDQKADALELVIPRERPTDFTTVFKVTGVL